MSLDTPHDGRTLGVCPSQFTTGRSAPTPARMRARRGPRVVAAGRSRSRLVVSGTLPVDTVHEVIANVIQLDCRQGFPDAEVARLSAGDSVEITGRVLTLRDASAARLAAALDRGEPLPVPLEGQIMYAVGPSPAKPGQIIGSAGPTTTERMGRYLPALFDAGVRAVIGKGELHGRDMAAFTSRGAIYVAAIGGLGALLGEADRVGGRDRLRGSRSRGALRARPRRVSGGRHHRPRREELPRDRARALASPALSPSTRCARSG